MRIAVLSYLASYGNAPILAKAFGELGHAARLIIRYTNAPGCDDYGFSAIADCLQAEQPDQCAQAREWIDSADLLVFMAAPALTLLWPMIYPKRKVQAGVFIATSSHLLKDPGGVNQAIDDAGLSVMAMPDKMPFLRRPSPAYWPPIAPLEVRDEQRIWIGHSPGKTAKHKWKGTADIKRVFRSLPVDCEIVEHKPHPELLVYRRHFSIWVDQMVRPRRFSEHPAAWAGGLGKSGLEAMAAGCAVVTGTGAVWGGVGISSPPVINTNRHGLFGVLQFLVRNPEECRQLGRSGRRWVREHCNPKTVAESVIQAA